MTYSHLRLFACTLGLSKARGKAEVELAELSKAKKFDIVFTKDSDSMLFRTVVVIRKYIQ